MISSDSLLVDRNLAYHHLRSSVQQVMKTNAETRGQILELIESSWREGNKIVRDRGAKDIKKQKQKQKQNDDPRGWGDTFINQGLSAQAWRSEFKVKHSGEAGRDQGRGRQIPRAPRSASLA